MLRMITLLFSGKSLQAEIKDGTNNILYFMFYGQSITRLFVQFSSHLYIRAWREILLGMRFSLQTLNGHVLEFADW